MAQAFVMTATELGVGNQLCWQTHPIWLSKRRGRVAVTLIGSSERCPRRPSNALGSSLVRQGSFEMPGSMGLSRRVGDVTAKGDFGRRHRR
jgi:hypothetical protein